MTSQKYVLHKLIKSTPMSPTPILKPPKKYCIELTAPHGSSKCRLLYQGSKGSEKEEFFLRPLATEAGTPNAGNCFDSPLLCFLLSSVFSAFQYFLGTLGPLKPYSNDGSVATTSCFDGPLLYSHQPPPS